MFNIVRVLECGNKFLFCNGKGDFIVASYSTTFERPECLLFKSDSQGEVSDWIELYGSKFNSGTPMNEAVFTVVREYNNTLANNNYNGAWAQ